MSLNTSLPIQRPNSILIRYREMPIKWQFYRHKKTGMKMIVSKSLINKLNKAGSIAAYTTNGQWLWRGTRRQFWGQFK